MLPCPKPFQVSVGKIRLKREQGEGERGEEEEEKEKEEGDEGEEMCFSWITVCLGTQVIASFIEHHYPSAFHLPKNSVEIPHHIFLLFFSYIFSVFFYSFTYFIGASGE